MFKAFVTGQSSFDEWDNYIEQLEKLNVSDLLSVYSDAVDRYHAINTALG